MRLLLLKDVRKLGHLGEVVDVRAGYARNYLLPCRLATDPTDENIAAIAEEKKRADHERARRLKEFERLVESLAEVSVTLEAKANEEGTLYGSIGAEEIAAALAEAGHPIDARHVALDAPIREIDNRTVTIRFTDEISAEVKVWVVREGGAPGDDEASEQRDEPGGDDASEAEEE